MWLMRPTAYLSTAGGFAIYAGKSMLSAQHDDQQDFGDGL